MTVDNDPSSFLWRLVPIGFATVFAGAIAIMVLGGLPDRGTSAEVGEAGAIIAFSLILLALVMLAPMFAVWSIAFVALRRVKPDPRTRATLSTCLSVAIGNAFVFMCMLWGATPDGRTTAEMGMLTLFTVLVGGCLTWWSFRTEVRT